MLIQGRDGRTLRLATLPDWRGMRSRLAVVLVDLYGCRDTGRILGLHHQTVRRLVEQCSTECTGEEADAAS